MNTTAMLSFTLRMLGEIVRGAVAKAPTGRVHVTSYRAWPVDLDVFGHVNNAMFLRVAELARWQQAANAGLVGPMVQHGWMFLVGETLACYRKPLPAFASFVVTTETSVDQHDKWLTLRHKFSSNEGPGAKVYAEITTKAVVKHYSGRTVRPSQLLALVPGSESRVSREGES